MKSSPLLVKVLMCTILGRQGTSGSRKEASCSGAKASDLEVGLTESKHNMHEVRLTAEHNILDQITLLTLACKRLKHMLVLAY